MSPTSHDQIDLTDPQRRELAGLVRAGSTAQRLALRALIVLMAADGQSDDRDRCIAGRVRGHRPQVAAPLVPGTVGGLARRRKRSGRRPVFTPRAGRRGQGLACQPPPRRGLPLSRWSCPELAEAGRSPMASAGRSRLHGAPVADRGRAQALAVPVLDLHPRPGLPRQGRSGCWTCTPARGTATPLGADEYVISADEKTSIQARCRCHPTLPPGRPGRCASTTNTTAAARWPTWPPTTSTAREVFGRCEPNTGIVPFMNLVEQVMTQEPYARAKRVFWVVDNGSSHRGQSRHRPARQARSPTRSWSTPRSTPPG